MTAVQLHKLNGDTSWLIRLPVSNQDAAFYNLVVDPWLDPTPQIDGSSLFSRQTRIEPATFASIAQLDQWLHAQSSGKDKLDAILFSHPFSDHLHPETLTDHESREILQRVTIFTTADSLSALHSLRVTLDPTNVVNLLAGAAKQDAHPTACLPTGMSIQHLAARDWAISPAWSKLHGAILISHFTAAQTVHILYSPHGITSTSLPTTLQQPPIHNEHRILIHSFDRQILPLLGPVSCGFPNILSLIPTLQPHTILATHDEHKRAQGIVGRLLKRTPFTLQHANQLVAQHHPHLAPHCLLRQLAPGEMFSA